MKIKLRDLVNSQTSLEKLGTSKTVPAKTKYAIGRIVGFVAEELKGYERVRIETCQKFGTVSEDGLRFNIPPESRVEFDAELTELLDAEITTPIQQLKFFDVSNDENLTALDYRALSWLISPPGDE